MNFCVALGPPCLLPWIPPTLIKRPPQRRGENEQWLALQIGLSQPLNPLSLCSPRGLIQVIVGSKQAIFVFVCVWWRRACFQGHRRDGPRVGHRGGMSGCVTARGGESSDCHCDRAAGEEVICRQIVMVEQAHTGWRLTRKHLTRDDAPATAGRLVSQICPV